MLVDDPRQRELEFQKLLGEVGCLVILRGESIVRNEPRRRVRRGLGRQAPNLHGPVLDGLFHTVVVQAGAQVVVVEVPAIAPVGEIADKLVQGWPHLLVERVEPKRRQEQAIDVVQHRIPAGPSVGLPHPNAQVGRRSVEHAVVPALGHDDLSIPARLVEPTARVSRDLVDHELTDTLGGLHEDGAVAFGGLGEPVQPCEAGPEVGSARVELPLQADQGDDAGARAIRQRLGETDVAGGG